MQRDTKIIAISNQKGGCGKTTVTMQLAGILGKDNKVLVVDADPQGTSTRWAASAEDANPFPATISGLSAAGSKVHQEVKKYMFIYDYIIIDCPPAVDSPIPQSALIISDLVIIPVIPSPADLWAAVGIKKLINNIQVVNESLQARILINMCQQNTNVAQETTSILDDFGIEKFKTKLSLRTAYRQSAVYGSTVLDIKGAEKATQEIQSLKHEVLSILHVK
jgi:chromosome partitioning protein